MRRLPLLPTLFVAAAVAVMIGLGAWQLERLRWKEALLARYAAAQDRPPLALPVAFDPADPPLFRRASGMCLLVESWRAESGRNLKDEPGWIHIAACRTGAEGSGFQAVMGWSPSPASPRWKGGPVSGVIGSDRAHLVRVFADKAAPGLQPAKPPSLDDIPNNHLFYAVQWFFFAAAAVVIYALALRKRGAPRS
jgi:surfeit locus 1 family protein